MSQFKAREYWNTVAGDSREQFNPQSMCVGDCENDGSGDKILVGSLNGTLRIYKPSVSGYASEDTLLEKNLGSPILQVACGIFASRTEEVHIAVLHPRCLAVHRLVKTPGSRRSEETSVVSGETDLASGVSYDLKLVYQHKLKHTAYNMCKGPFGRTSGQTDFICVQSLDGVITTFENDVVSFACYLPEFLLPGPIVYSKQLDAIFTASSARFVQCYRYEAIAKAASSDATKMDRQSTKRVTPYWSVDVGEHVQDITDIVLSDDRKATLNMKDIDEDDSCLMVLGDRSLYCLEADGSIRFAKKLESPPCCYVPYGLAHAPEGESKPTKARLNVLTLIAYHSHRSLAILSNTRLAWAASLPTAAPIAMTVANFQSTENERRGIIVTIEDGGRISCLYLGTEPLEGATQALSIRRQIQADRTEETATLLSLIRSVEKNDTDNEAVEKLVTTDLRLDVDTKMSYEVPTAELASAIGGSDPGAKLPCAVLMLSMHAPSDGGVHDIAVTVRCDHPVAVDPPGIVVNQVAAGTSSDLQFRFFIVAPSTISNANAAVMASYTSSSGYPNSVVKDVRLPLPLFVAPAPPEKEASCKITFESNKPCANLNDLFKDVHAERAISHNSTAFEFPCGSVVSVLCSRSSQRYRIQSSSFPALWLIMDELSSRLTRHYEHADPGGEPLKLAVRQDLPLREYYDLIDGHFLKRQELHSCMSLLEQRAVEFRMLQKRLLMRIKEKTPTTLGYLDMLLTRSYDLISKLCAEEEFLRLELHRSSVELSAGTRGILILLQLYLNLMPEECQVLEAVLSPHIGEPTDPVGWEETTDINLLHLLRTQFAKNKREADVNLDSAMPTPESTIDLKKHLSLFIKRLHSRSQDSPGSGKSTADMDVPAKQDRSAASIADHPAGGLPQVTGEDQGVGLQSSPADADVERAADNRVSSSSLPGLPPLVEASLTGQ